MAYVITYSGGEVFKAFVIHAETRVIDDEEYTDVRLFGSEGNVMYYPATYNQDDDTMTISSNYAYGELNESELDDLANQAAMSVGCDFGQFIYDTNVPSIDSMLGWFEI